jgi:DNA-binding protein HU-beta
MNKAELIASVAEATGCTQKSVGEIVDATTAAIIASVAAGEPVRLVGFGSFARSFRKQRTAKNPQTQEPVTVVAHNVPRFKPGKEFREATL